MINARAMLAPQTREKWSGLAWCAAIPMVFFVIGCCVVHSVGLSWDEDFQRVYGKMVVDYNATFGADTHALHYRNMYLYGGFFDVLGAGLERLVPALRYDVLRHLLSLAFAAGGLFYTARLAAFFAGPRAGFIAALTLMLIPRYFGHAFFNPKDTPFAALYVCSLYYLIELVDALPARNAQRKWWSFAIACGFCLGIRIGALLLFTFLAAGVSLWAAEQAWSRARPVREQLLAWAWVAAASVSACCVATAIALVFWPYLRANPPLRLLSVLAENSNFQTQWNAPVLFAGKVGLAASIGRIYLPTWLWISVPPFVWVGVLLVVLVGLRVRPWAALRGRMRAAAVLILGLVLPPVYAIFQNVTLYDGMRQFLFILPPLAVIAGLGWYWALHFASTRGRRAMGAVFVLALAEPAVWLVRSHPYEYTYFSPIVGGLKEQSYRFESDYWGTSFRAAAEFLDRYRHEQGMAQLVVAQGGIFKEWGLIKPFLEDPARVVLASGAQRADVTVELNRAREPGPWMQDPHILYRVQVVEGQMPFLVVTKPGGY